jgi:hypothetical protein
VPSTEHRPDPFNDTFVAIAAARAVITATQLGVIDALAGWLGDAGFQEVDVHRSDTSPWRLLYVARG